MLLTSTNGSRVLPLVSAIQPVSWLEAQRQVWKPIWPLWPPSLNHLYLLFFPNWQPTLEGSLMFSHQNGPQRLPSYSPGYVQNGSNSRYTRVKNNPKISRFEGTRRDLKADLDRFSVKFFSLSGPSISLAGNANTFSCSLSHETVILTRHNQPIKHVTQH